MVAFYYYQEDFELKVYSWVQQHASALVRFVPTTRKARVTSDWFMVGDWFDWFTAKPKPSEMSFGAPIKVNPLQSEMKSSDNF
jgi:hypothetical protein